MTSKSIGIIYSLWYTSVPNLMSVKQRALKILSSWYISMSQFDPWPLTYDLKINRGLSTPYNIPVYQVWCLSSKGFSRYWADSIFLCPVWPLTFDHVISKSVVVIYFLWCISALSLMFVNHRILKILNGQYIPISSLTLDLWPCDLKINRGYLLLTKHQCTKFNICQAKGS